MTTFAELGLRAELLTALTALGLRGADADPARRDPAAHRRARPARSGRDRHRQDGGVRPAAAAALEPGDRRPSPIALVLVPTRELAMQVSEAIHRYGRALGARVLPIYGGQPIGRQLGALRDGVDVVVATPGRALDHIGRGTLASTASRMVVLDEADEMLDMGFAEDIEAILEATPDDRQTVLFSATMPPRIDAIAKRHLRDPVRIQIERAAATATPCRRRPAGVRRAARPQAGRARARARRRGADGGDRVLPHPHRGRPAHRDAQRARLPGRGAARRHDPGAARPGDGPPARRHRRPARRHRRRRPRPRHRSAHPRRQLRRAVGPRGLRAPHRPRRPRRPRGRRHHARRAPRAPPARNIERVTRQKITIEKVPSVADLRARRSS